MESFIIQLRGLPYSATPEEIVAFLEIPGEHVTEVEILKSGDGRPSGEGYVALSDQGSAEQCLTRHKQTMGTTGRYVEIYKSELEKMQKAVSNSRQADIAWDGIVRLRGLPFSCGMADVKGFLAGLAWSEEGSLFPLNGRGTSTGECFIQFESFEQGEQALQRNKGQLGGRYIEVFKSSNTELRRAIMTQQKLQHQKIFSQFGNPSHPGPAAAAAPKWGGLNMGGMGAPMMGGGGGPPQGFGARNGSRAAQNGGFNSPAAGPPSGGWATDAPAAGQTTNGFQAIKQPAYPAPDPACPYDHVVCLGNLPASQVPEVQDFFRPHRAIAVNISGGGKCDVAFKTLELAEKAMEKQTEVFKGVNMTFTLKSR